ncbi:MAG TPA: amino acid adenylation domain-containing protein [Thermoanaerobaculia bacterium]|nr:amino acid adenylation domain-containing protein [Thermoanaerobaculia bacterium]
MELGEVEAALARHPAVEHSVVVTQGDGGDRRLVAYVVPAGEAPPDLARGLRDFLRESLPEAMVPSAVVLLDRLPVTPGGKVDRRALPRPDFSEVSGRGQVPPRGEVAETLAMVWARLLGVDRVGGEDDFFDLGGHSLLATQLVSRIREVFGVELPLRRLFETPTLQALASAVEAARGEERGMAAPPVVPVPRDGDLPLSFAQERLWFLDQLQPGQPTYNIPSALRMSGPLSPAALAGAFAEVVRRHEALRTTFPAVAGRPVQRIAPPAPFPLPVVDLGALPAGEGEREATRLTALEAAHPFDLAAGPLLRAGLLRLGEGEHLLLATLHHIVSDGWSMGILIRELGAAYQALAAGTSPVLPELPVQYADWAVWQRQWLQGDVLEAQLAYWRRQLGGDVAVLELPADRPRPAVATFQGSHRSAAFPTALAESLEALSRREEATLFMTLLAAFDVLLARLTGQTDVPVGTPVAGRSRGEVEGLIGLFLNTVVLREDLAGDPPFRALLARLRGTALDAFAHQDVPFERLVEDLQPRRTLNQTPLFQVMLVLQNAPGGEPGAGDLILAPVSTAAPTARFDLTLVLQPAGDGLHASAEYRSDLFEGATVERWLGHFRTLLEGIVADPARRISDLPLLTPAERDQIVSAWNDTAEDLGSPACLHDLFYEQAARAPDAPALLWKDGQTTYGNLARQADRLARHLREKGVGPGGLVALLLDPSPERVAAVLAVLRAGAAYVPLDPAYPADRLDFMMVDTGAALLLTRETLAAALEEPDEGEPAAFPSAAPDDRAYVIYTSGSTGRPKGVVIRHAAAVNTVRDVNRRFGVGPGDRVFAVSALSFDLSVYDLFGPLAVGGAVVLPEPSATPDPAAWSAALARHGVTVWDSAPALMDLLVSSGAPLPETLRLVLLSGDWIPLALPREIRRRVPGARVISLGGATEASIWSILYPIGDIPPAWTSIPYGRPMANQAFHVLDPAGHPAPMGVAGELHIGGAGVADGYHARPDLTAEKFIPDPFSDRPGARLYRTGDLGRRFADGIIEFLGRRDHQVKIRGFRIELGEIEAVLTAHPAVREAVVLARQEEGLAKSAGLSQARLVAYVVPEPGADLDLAALRAHLATRLPEHMVPSALVPLEAIPLTPNGKMDRRALPSPDMSGQDPDREHVPPRSGVEVAMAGLWRDLLKVERVGAHDGFFDLGGHSLLATQLVSRVREAFGVELPLRRLFEAPTLSALSAALEAARSEDQALAAPPVVRVPRDGDLPLSFAQERLWFLDQLQPGLSTYNIPSALRMTGPLAPAALASAFTEVVRRHEALRTTFRAVAGQPVQRIAPPAPFGLPIVDLSALAAGAREREAGRLTAEETARPFDLVHGPLLRAGLVRLEESEHLLLATLHHIVSDGWSMGVLVRELGEAYQAFAQGRRPSLPALPVQYADWAVWQRQWLQGDVLEAQLGYWRRQLGGGLAVLELPADRPRPAVATFRGDHRAFALPASLTESLEALGRREEATLFMTLLAAFDVLLSRLTGQTDVPVGTPVAGRGRGEAEGLIGLFLNTLVLRGDLSGDPGFRDLLVRLRGTALDAYAHQDIPFEKLVEDLQPQRSLNQTPLFQVMLVLQNTPEGTVGAGDLTLAPVPAPASTSRFDLTLVLQPAGDGLHGSVEYRSDLFDGTTVERWLGHWRTLLEGLAADPDRRISDLPLLTPAERDQIVSAWNDTAEDLGPAACLHGLFYEQAARTPDAPALLWKDGQTTYGDLARQADRLARRLRERGVGPGDLVALLLDPSPERVAAVLAVLRAGAAYVPLDPAYPADRLDFMVEDTGAALLLTREALAAALEEPDEGELAAFPSAAPDDRAYVIYTSGSTGRPKGVVIRHAAAANTVRDVNRRFGVGPEDRVFAVSALSFDLSVYDLFGPLAVGAAVVLPEPSATPDPAAWSAALARHGVTVWNSAPALMDLLVSSEAPLPETLRLVLLSGDWIPIALPGEIRRRDPGARVISLGGATEASIWSILYPIGDVPPSWTSIPYGRPMANQTFHVLDPAGHPAPVGVAGELHIGGAGVADGYHARPDLTAEKFVPDPFADQPGARLYRTGDLGRRFADGTIEFLGRRDLQVKIRGFRIELGEIEAVLTAHPAVREAVVLARQEEGLARSAGLSQARLVAYVVPAPEAALDLNALRAHLATRLPEHMVPSALVPLEAIPLTPNGKVDRRALPAPEAGPDQQTEFVPPRDGVEETIAALWKDLLKAERVGVHDNFFSLGGHSLLATRVAAALRDAFGVEVPLRTLFEKPTVADLALAVAHLRLEQADTTEAARLLDTLEGLSDEEVEALLAGEEGELEEV